MGDFKDKRPPAQSPPSGSRPSAPERGARASGGPVTPPARPGDVRDKASSAGAPEGPRGRIVHDERGNAVWDWLKETSRIAIESTSRLLRKLELPELKVEDKKDEELRLESDRDTGGGYDPYNGGTPSRKGGGRK